MPSPLSWIEVNARALRSNLSCFRKLLPTTARLMAVVKGDAYGHGMVGVARLCLAEGAEWLGVFNLGEASVLRQAGISAPILALGYVPRSDLGEAITLDVRITTSSLETIVAAGNEARKLGAIARLHLKLETGTNRLGFDGNELTRALAAIRDDNAILLEGAHTHFANIEDTTEHDYARGQLNRFGELLAKIRQAGFEVSLPHTACSAAAILFPETYFAMVRVGIGLYGLWPSKETLLSARQEGRNFLKFEAAMTWKTQVVQVKSIPAGAFVGYGCTYKTTRPTLLAILPIGYANGYDRSLSNKGHVLIRGRRAPIRGRVCMNLTMVDVTDIPGVSLEDEVVLLGQQQDERISAEQMASWADTINYEIVTRADPGTPRIYVGID
jgi:alanine racemase